MQYMKKMMFCLFFLYAVILAEILFLSREPDPSFSVLEYLFVCSNLRPFETVLRYTVFFLKRRDLPSFCLMLFNLGGNFVLFLPMGFFLTVLFPRFRAFRKCFFPIFGTVLAVELLQGVLRVGIPDIDDLIVNMAGACVGMLFGKNFLSRCHRKPLGRIHFE